MGGERFPVNKPYHKIPSSPRHLTYKLPYSHFAYNCLLFSAAVTSIQIFFFSSFQNTCGSLPVFPAEPRFIRSKVKILIFFPCLKVGADRPENRLFVFSPELLCFPHRNRYNKNRIYHYNRIRFL